MCTVVFHYGYILWSLEFRISKSWTPCIREVWGFYRLLLIPFHQQETCFSCLCLEDMLMYVSDSLTLNSWPIEYQLLPEHIFSITHIIVFLSFRNIWYGILTLPLVVILNKIANKKHKSKKQTLNTKKVVQDVEKGSPVPVACSLWNRIYWWIILQHWVMF